MTPWDGGSRSPRQITLQEIVSETIPTTPIEEALQELCLSMLELNAVLASRLGADVPIPGTMLTRARMAGQRLLYERQKPIEHEWFREARTTASRRDKKNQARISGQKRRMESGFAEGYREDLILEQ